MVLAKSHSTTKYLIKSNSILVTNNDSNILESKFSKIFNPGVK